MSEFENVSDNMPASFRFPHLLTTFYRSDAIGKFLSGAGLSLILALFAFIDIYTGNPKAPIASVAFLMFGIFLGIVGVLLPSMNWWINDFLFPFLGLPLVIAILFIGADFQYRLYSLKKKREHEKKPAPTLKS